MITELVTGGFGTLGQAAGAGIQDYRAQQEAAATRADFDALTKWAGEAQAAGMSPGEAARLAAEKFPRLMGGGQGLGPAPRPNVPGLNQGTQVAGQVPLQPASPLGSLGAPQYAPPPQSEQQYTVGQTSPMLEQALAAGDATRSAPRPQGTVPERPPEAQPQGQPGPQSGPQSSGFAQGQSNMSPAQGRGPMPVTPRNLPYAQLLMQRESQQANVGGRLAALEQKGNVEAMKEAGRNDRAKFDAETKVGIVSAQLEAKLKQFDVANQTDIWQSLMQYYARRAAIAQSGLNAGQRDKTLLELYKSNNGLLGKVSMFRGMDAELDKEIDKLTADQSALKLVVGGVQNVPGEEEVVPANPGGPFGLGATPEGKKPGKPTSVIKPPTPAAPAKPPAAAAPSASAKTVVKTQTNPRTGQKRIVYSDGTTEVR